ncbi:MAG TPA: hypothetical protein VGK58_10305 [Lacipirellulaceae bacterium]
MPKPNSANDAGKPAVTKNDYLFLASLLAGRDSTQRVGKKEPRGEILRTCGEMYESREYVAAYESFKPAYEKIVADMERVLARNLDFESNKLAKERRIPVAAARNNVQKLKAHAQQTIDQLQRLRRDLESKPLVRLYLKKGGSAAAAALSATEEPATTEVNSANETRLEANTLPTIEALSENRDYKKAPYVPPETGALYCVLDKEKGERIIRVIGKSPDGTLIQAETLKDGQPSKRPIQLTVESLARQAAKGWCSLLLPVAEADEARTADSEPAAAEAFGNAIMRLDIQNFGRCCADINRASIKFDTQLIKDVGDGPFRAGQYEQAFLTFEQFAMSFTSAVATSRQKIAEGRRALNAEKGNLSGKEIQERTAAFIRQEQLIHTAEREFSKILEGLRTYLRANAQSPRLSTS